MRKGAKLVAALTMTVSLVAMAGTGAEAQRRNRGEPAAPAAPTVSRGFGTAYGPVNTAITAQNWAAADAALPALRAASTTPYEQFLAAQTEFRIAAGTHTAERQLSSIDAMIASNGAPEADRQRLFIAGGQIAYNLSQFAKASGLLQQAVALGNASQEVQLLRLDAMFRADQTADALAYANTLITEARAANRTVPESVYSLMARALQEADRDADLSSVLLDRMESYPTEFNYRTAALVFLRVAPSDNRNLNIDVLRFVIASGAANDRRIYLEHVGNLAEEGLPYEAAQVIQAGRTANLIPTTDATFNSILSTQQDKLTEDRASLAGLERRALASADAHLATVAGDANLGYRNNARAEELYTAALTKTGADADLLNLRIGVARFQADNFAGAIESFDRVQGALRRPVSRMWTTLARSRLAPVAAPAAPAAPATPAPTN